MNNEQKKIRRGVLLLIAAATVLFFAALWGVFVLRERIPQMRAGKIEALLESGDAAAARPLIRLDVTEAGLGLLADVHQKMAADQALLQQARRL